MSKSDIRRQPYRIRAMLENRWLVVAAVVVLVGVAILLADLGSESTPAAPEPVEIAREFIEARNEYDAVGMISLLAEEAQITGDLAQGPDQLSAVAALEEAVGVTALSVECFDSSIEGSIRAHCTYQMESDWSRALGFDPIDGNNLRIIVEEGKILNMSVGLNFNGIAEAQRGFTDWLEANHPDAVSLIFRQEDTPAPRPILTPEAAEHLARYTAEFVAAMADGG